jgi:hypothetical protein
LEGKEVEMLPEEVKERRFTDILVEHWIPGQRHRLAWAYASDLYQAGASLDGALLMIQEITTRANDDEARDRVRVVEDVFSGKSKLAPWGYVNRMLGITLEEARQAAFLDMSPKMRVEFLRFMSGAYCVGKDCPRYRNCPQQYARYDRKRRKGLLR